MPTESRKDKLFNQSLWVTGGIGAIGATILGYSTTYFTMIVLVPSEELMEGFETEIVGWAFFGAHFVDIIEPGRDQFNALQLSAMAEPNIRIIYLLPIISLILVGYLIGSRKEVKNNSILVIIPFMVVYVVLGLFLTTVFEISNPTGIGAATTAYPDRLRTIFMFGIYSLVFPIIGMLLSR